MTAASLAVSVPNPCATLPACVQANVADRALSLVCLVCGERELYTGFSGRLLDQIYDAIRRRHGSPEHAAKPLRKAVIPAQAPTPPPPFLSAPPLLPARPARRSRRAR